MFKLSKSKHLNLAEIYERGADLVHDIPLIKRRRKRRKVLKFLKYFLYAASILFLLVVIFFSAYVLNLLNSFKELSSGTNDIGGVASLIGGVGGELSPKGALTDYGNGESRDWAEKDGLPQESKNARSDYLMVEETDAGSPKAANTDINRSIDYRVDQGVNGIFAKLRLNYAHNGRADLGAAEYKAYVRIYVPPGSRLITAEPQAESEEHDNILPLGSPKTSFGAFLSIVPGGIGSLYFEYKLPEDINESAKDGFYGLYITKQPKGGISELTVDVKLSDKVKSYNPVGFYVERIGDNEIKWETDILSDRKFEIRS